MKSESESWVAVGILLRPHALGGAMIVKPLTRSPAEFIDAPLRQVTLRRAGVMLGTFGIVRRTMHSAVPLIMLEGINDRTAAEKLLGAEMVIPAEDRWEPEDGKYYMDDLAGIALVDADSGTPVATAIRAEEGPAHDFLIFPHPGNPGKEVMLPLIPQFVPEIDIKARQARVRIPEGLLDL